MIRAISVAALLLVFPAAADQDTCTANGALCVGADALLQSASVLAAVTDVDEDQDSSEAREEQPRALRQAIRKLQRELRALTAPDRQFRRKVAAAMRNVTKNLTAAANANATEVAERNEQIQATRKLIANLTAPDRKLSAAIRAAQRKAVAALLANRTVDKTAEAARRQRIREVKAKIRELSKKAKTTTTTTAATTTTIAATTTAAATTTEEAKPPEPEDESEGDSDGSDGEGSEGEGESSEGEGESSEGESSGGDGDGDDNKGSEGDEGEGSEGDGGEGSEDDGEEDDADGDDADENVDLFEFQDEQQPGAGGTREQLQALRAELKNLTAPDRELKQQIHALRKNISTEMRAAAAAGTEPEAEEARKLQIAEARALLKKLYGPVQELHAAIRAEQKKVKAALIAARKASLDEEAEEARQNKIKEVKAKIRELKSPKATTSAPTTAAPTTAAPTTAAPTTAAPTTPTQEEEEEGQVTDEEGEGETGAADEEGSEEEDGADETGAADEEEEDKKPAPAQQGGRRGIFGRGRGRGRRFR